jgi:hypothetical protein
MIDDQPPIHQYSSVQYPTSRVDPRALPKCTICSEVAFGARQRGEREKSAQKRDEETRPPSLSRKQMLKAIEYHPRGPSSSSTGGTRRGRDPRQQEDWDDDKQHHGYLQTCSASAPIFLPCFSVPCAGGWKFSGSEGLTSIAHDVAD